MPRSVFISVSQLARRWKMARETILRACEDGRLAGACRPLGKAWRIPTATVLEQERSGERIQPVRASRMTKEGRALVKRYFG